MKLLLLLACGNEPATLTPVAETPLAVEQSPGRSWRRMNIDQLRASMEQASGGIGWTEEQDGEAVQLFDALSGSLGKPDYLSATEEELAPGLLFQKFLSDAADSICRELVAVDPGRAEPTLFVYAGPEDTDPAAIDANLRAALLRFHGRRLAEGDPALAGWHTLLERVYADSGDMSLAWRAVCVGLYTHPDFYSF